MRTRPLGLPLNSSRIMRERVKRLFPLSVGFKRPVAPLHDSDLLDFASSSPFFHRYILPHAPYTHMLRQVIFSSDEDGHTFEIGLEGNMPLAFVIYCRVWAITQADTEGPGGGWTLDALGLAKILQSGRDVSSEHGKRWRQLATIALQSQLAGLPTSLDDDAAMLSAMEAGGNPGGWEGPTDNLMQAVRFRMGHKKILLDTIASLASF